MCMESFIETYDGALTDNECDILIEEFEDSLKEEGYVYQLSESVVDTDIKKCRSLVDSNFSDQSLISKIVRSSLNNCIDEYVKKYPGLNSYLNTWGLDDIYSFQKYEDETDGFKKWHTEHGPGPTSERILAWMFYLNNADSGTDFLYYDKLDAKKGMCVIWPAGWTHFHRGVDNIGLKYVVTGWVIFQ